MTPLATRVATAAVLVPCVLAALFLLPPVLWAAATLVAVLIAAHEWARLASFGRAGWLLLVGGLAASGAILLAVSGAGLDDGWPREVLLAACGLATLFWLAVAPPWVVRRWPTRSPVALTLAGWVVLSGAWVALVELQARSPWLVMSRPSRSSSSGTRRPIVMSAIL